MSRASKLLERRTKKANRLSIVAFIVAILALASGGGFVYAAVSQQTGPLYACFDDTSGGIVRVSPYATWTEYQHACSSNSHLRSAASADAGTTTATTQPTTTIVTTTTKPTTTTQPPTTTQPTTTTQPNVGDTTPISGGYFQVLPPGSILPTEAYCASHIHYSTWEPRPDNTTANHTVGGGAGSNMPLANYGQMDSTWNSTYKPRINGDFTGTTDEIFQFYACKWGWSDDLLRAEAISESNWHQSQVGDNNTSFGILQVRYLYHPRVNGGCQNCAGSSWPDSQRSTPFNVDAFAAETRGVYDGHSTFLNGNDIWGDIQSWYCGCEQPNGGNQWYSNQVKGYYTSKPWLGWSG